MLFGGLPEVLTISYSDYQAAMSGQCKEGTIQKQATTSQKKIKNPLFTEALQCQ